jgi:hypothetical protein
MNERKKERKNERMNEVIVYRKSPVIWTEVADDIVYDLP